MAPQGFRAAAVKEYSRPPAAANKREGGHTETVTSSRRTAPDPSGYGGAIALSHTGEERVD
jgi:hypothetical protein